jgi:hypothetical protein
MVCLFSSLSTLFWMQADNVAHTEPRTPRSSSSSSSRCSNSATAPSSARTPRSSTLSSAEEHFQQYEDGGIAPHVPPRFTQRLVALHDEDGRPDLVEHVMVPHPQDKNAALRELTPRFRTPPARVHPARRATTALNPLATLLLLSPPSGLSPLSSAPSKASSAPSSPLAAIFRRPQTPLTSPLGQSRQRLVRTTCITATPLSRRGRHRISSCARRRLCCPG